MNAKQLTRIKSAMASAAKEKQPMTIVYLSDLTALINDHFKSTRRLGKTEHNIRKILKKDAP